MAAEKQNVSLSPFFTNASPSHPPDVPGALIAMDRLVGQVRIGKAFANHAVDDGHAFIVMRGPPRLHEQAPAAERAAHAMGAHANPLLADPGDQAIVVRQPMHRRMTDADPRPQHQQPDLIDRHRRVRIEAVQDEAARPSALLP